VTVGVDESDEALGAVAWAARYADAANTGLRLVHAIAPVEWMFGAAVAFSPEGLGAKLSQHADEVLARATTTAREAAPGLSVQTQVLDGGAVAEALAQAAADSLLLVIAAGSAGGGLREAMLGGHVTRTVLSSPVPVVVWRAPEATRTGPPLPVAVGVDESEPAERAVRAAFAAAAVLRAPVQVAHMWETGAAVGLGYGEGPTDWPLEHVLKAEQEQQITALVAPVATDFPHVHQVEVRTDTTPIKGLTEVSGSAQLLVVGSRGRGRLAGAVLGSVSQALLHHARCPLLVVH